MSSIKNNFKSKILCCLLLLIVITFCKKNIVKADDPFFNYKGAVGFYNAETNVGIKGVILAYENGYLGKDMYMDANGEVKGDPVYDMLHFSGSGGPTSLNNIWYLIGKYAGSLNNRKADNDKAQGLQDIFCVTIDDLYEADPDLKKDYNISREKHDVYWKNDVGVITAITSGSLYERLGELEKIAKNGCKDSKTINFYGYEMECSKLAWDTSNYSETTVGISAMKHVFGNRTYPVTGGYAEQGFTKYDTGRRAKYLDKYAAKYEKYHKSSHSDGGTAGVTSNTCDDGKLFCYETRSNYYPSIKNVYEHSKKLDSAGELNSGEFANSMKGLVKEFANILALFGRYIMYGAIMFFGVKAIFQGADGRADFKETLPYILVFIIFFYTAPNLVDIFQNKIFITSDYDQIMDSAFATLVYIVRIAAFAGIIFVGVKILFSSGADRRANMSKMLIPVFVGCLFVFASTFVVNVTTESISEVAGDKTLTPLNIPGQYLIDSY